MSNTDVSFYISQKFENRIKVPPYKEIIPVLENSLTKLCERKGLIINTDEKKILTDGCSIEYRLYYSSVVKRYILSFTPKNVWEYAKKSELETAFTKTMNFVDSLKDLVTLMGIHFQRYDSKKVKSINIADWGFSLLNDTKLRTLSNINYGSMTDLASEVYASNQKKIDLQLLIVDGSSKIKDLIKADQLKNKVKAMFKNPPEVINVSDNLLEVISQRHDRDNLFLLYIGEEADVEKNYKSFKNYLLPHGIPSQFMSISRLDNKLKYGLINLIFEVIKKSSIEPIQLDPRTEIDVDGFLCLSDISSASGKYFGVSIEFTGGNVITDDYLEMYTDISYESKYQKINFGEGQLSKLASKLSALSTLNGKKIDLFLTKKWRSKDVSYFLERLEELNIHIRKCMYISQKTNRFLFREFYYNNNKLIHPYIIIDDALGSIQTNTEIKNYGTMYPIHVEMMNAWDYNLTEADMIRILWLVKKRIYRLKSFFGLKLPENIALFSDVQGLQIGSITGVLKIKVNHLL